MDLKQQGSSRAEHPAKDTDAQDTRPHLFPVNLWLQQHFTAPRAMIPCRVPPTYDVQK